MKDKGKTILTYFTLLIVCLYFLFSGLVQAKSFLAPLSVAALLAMVMLPVCRWFERKGVKRGFAVLFSDLLILLFFVLLTWIVGTQINSFTKDWSKIQQRLQPKIEQVQQYIEKKTGLSADEQKQKLTEQLPGSPFASGQEQSNSSSKSQGQQKQRSATESHGQQQQSSDNSQNASQQPGSSSQGGSGSQQSGGAGSMLSTAGSFVSHLFSFLGTFLLTFIYIFFFLLYRTKFRKAILKMVPEERQEKAQKIITDSTKISQNYLFGRLILITFLAVLYAVGLSISGVKNAILISILAAVLSLLPYIGNIIGYVLAVGMAFFSGSGLMGAVGVSITFTIAQFVESYILEPYVVGDKVDISPVFTIIVVVLGGAVWGVMGMLIAIPALGILKVICDHIPALQPLGFLFGAEDTDDTKEDSDNIFKKTKRWALNKFH